MKHLFVYFSLLFVAVGQSAAQVDTCCAGSGQVRLEFDFLDMLRQIEAYEDTIEAITGTPIIVDYRQLESTPNRLYQQYDGFDLESSIYNLRVLLAQARASADGGACAPCSKFQGTGGGVFYNHYDYSERELCGDNASYCYLRSLHTGAFLNGDSILFIDSDDDESWQVESGPAMTEHPYMGTSVEGIGLQTESYYGYHYNLHAVVDERKLCPPGWAIPDSAIFALALEESEVPTVMRRLPDASWIEKESWLVTSQYGDYTEHETTVSMNALSFAGEEVPGSVAFYAKNHRDSYSIFGLPDPNSGYLDVDENHGVTVSCYLKGWEAMFDDPYYVEWAADFRSRYPERATAADQNIVNNILLSGDLAANWNDFHDFPHVRTEDAESVPGTMVLLGDMYYCGEMVTEVGFVIGTSPNLSVSDTLVAAVADSLDFNGLQTCSGNFLLDTLPTQTLYYSAYAKSGTDQFGDRYMFGDTLELVYTDSFDCGVESVTYDGHVYPTVQIGEQCWFAENLRNTAFANGEAIVEGYNDDVTDWTTLSTAAQTRHGAPDDSEEALFVLELYGRLYNWYAVTDQRGLCPTGWHVPTDGEWTALTDFLGGVTEAAAALKAEEIGDVGLNYGWDGTNSSGFSALPGGFWSDGESGAVFFGGGWWSSTLTDLESPEFRLLFSFGEEAPETVVSSSFSDEAVLSKSDALSVRCIKGSQQP